MMQRLKVKGLNVYILPLTWKVTNSGLQFKVAYWPAMTLGGAAQVAAAHCWMNGLWTPQSAAITNLHPSMFSGNNSLFLVASITRY